MKQAIKILYIDDTKVIQNHLLHQDYILTSVKTLNDTKTKILLEDFDLLITEISVKDGNCLDFIKELKKTNSMEFIVVSNNKEPKHLLKILELDIKYFAKPIDLDELAFTIEKLLNNKNKINPIKEELIELEEGFSYNTLHQYVKSKDDNKIILTLQESNLLQALIKQRNHYCHHENLLEAISVSNTPSTIDTLRTVIKNIRRKTYENIIESLVGIGYKINIPSLKDSNYIALLNGTEQINKKILIAKENKEHNRTLQKNLEQYGFKCESIFSLKEAKEALKFDTFDYVILDIKFSDGDGADLIRDNQNMKQNKYIVLSNTEDIHYKEYLYFKGIIDYIEKSDDFAYIAYSIYQTVLKIELNDTSNNILLIENSKKIITQIEDILLPRNYNIDVTNTSGNVLDLLNHKSYSIIILDLELEDINSLDFLITLKINVNKSLPIIML